MHHKVDKPAMAPPMQYSRFIVALLIAVVHVFLAIVPLQSKSLSPREIMAQVYAVPVVCRHLAVAIRNAGRYNKRHKVFENPAVSQEWVRKRTGEHVKRMEPLLTKGVCDEALRKFGPRGRIVKGLIFDQSPDIRDRNRAINLIGKLYVISYRCRRARLNPGKLWQYAKSKDISLARGASSLVQVSELIQFWQEQLAGLPNEAACKRIRQEAGTLPPGVIAGL